MAKQRVIVGMENPVIEELNTLAEEYVQYRDKRQQIGVKEVELKQKLLGSMKKHKLTEYKHENIQIEVILEEESLKVRLIKEDPDEE